MSANDAHCVFDSPTITLISQQHVVHIRINKLLHGYSLLLWWWYVTRPLINVISSQFIRNVFVTVRVALITYHLITSALYIITHDGQLPYKQHSKHSVCHMLKSTKDTTYFSVVQHQFMCQFINCTCAH